MCQTKERGILIVCPQPCIHTAHLNCMAHKITFAKDYCCPRCSPEILKRKIVSQRKKIHARS